MNNTNQKHYYAEWDTFVGLNPREFNSGFANTKCAVAFESKQERDQWITNTRYNRARMITRKEAFVRDMLCFDGEYYVPVAVYLEESDNFEMIESKRLYK